MPSAAFSHSVAIAGSPDSVWRRMQEPEVWVGVGPIERVRDAGIGEGGTLESYRWEATIAGRTWEGTAQTTDAEPGELMRVRLDSPEIRADLSARLAPNGDGTRLEIRIEAASKGMLASLFWGLIEQAIRTSLPEQTEEFGRRVAES